MAEEAVAAAAGRAAAVSAAATADDHVAAAKVEADMVVDVVVVGAGLSGLRAAVEVHRAGLTCVVLEAMDRVGGKVLSVDAAPALDGQGEGSRRKVVDLGAAWINDTSQSEMLALASRFKLDLIEQRIAGRYLRQERDGSVVQYPLGFGEVSVVLSWLACLSRSVAVGIQGEKTTDGR